MLLIGIVASSLVFSVVLRTFSELYLIQIIQSAAMITFHLEWHRTLATRAAEPRPGPRAGRAPDSRTAFAMFANVKGFKRMLVAIALGTTGFFDAGYLARAIRRADIQFERWSNDLAHRQMSVGTLIAFFLSERLLNRGRDPVRIAAVGVVSGLAAFAGDYLCTQCPVAAAFPKRRLYHWVRRRLILRSAC